MDEEFWQGRWRENEIPFHEGKPNALFYKKFSHLKLPKRSRVFVPLCGKAVDLDWLANSDHHVIGVEFNKPAVEEIFERGGLVPKVRNLDRHRQYSAGGLEVYVGDFFDLTAEMTPAIDAVYDRGALVALPATLRQRYARHLTDIVNGARQLIISYDYDQTQTDGPPFSVAMDEINALYGDRYRIELLASEEISGQLSKRCSGNENAWLLEPI